MHSTRDREFDVILWGATGFTGRLVAEYLQQRYGDGSLRWALGGRDEAKLAALRAELGAPELPLVLGDALDEAAMAALARRARVVCTTVGPYARYGAALVAACAAAGTDYCDLAGEPPWIDRMRREHDDTARASGARIVSCCGFDSIPSDLGVLFAQREVRLRYGAPSPHVKGALARASGGVSGGTIATLLETLANPPRRAAPDRDRSGGGAGAPRPELVERFHPHWDADFQRWTAPSTMAPINGRVVRRSATLLAELYGPGMRYEEALLTGRGPLGALRATAVALGLGVALGALAIGPLRRLVAPRLPQPGEGPSAERRERGRWEMRFVALAPADGGATPLRVRVTGDRDPGYGSTAKMLGESAVCLARDELDTLGGFHTPAAAMGGALLERLQRNAGVTFEAT